MKKHTGFFIKALLFIAVIYVWPSCNKNGNDPATPSGSDSTKTDTTKNTNDTIVYKGWVVTTLAGSGTYGYADGVGTAAKFSNPSSITIDAYDNIYLAESITHSIRKITPSGVVSTLVKEDSSAGYVFGKIDEIITDKQGNFFLPNYENRTYYIRKLTTNLSTIFAGNTLQGFKDGLGTDARFNITYSIAIDPNNNMYVPDYDGQGKFAIRKITPAGLVTTLSLTDNTGISNGYKDRYHAITADTQGNLYFADGTNISVIKKIDPQGNVTVVAGTDAKGFKDGKGQQAQFGVVISLQVDKTGNIWLCDPENYAIRRISPDGTVTTIAGGTSGYKNGNAAEARFKTPYELAISSDGAVYIIDYGTNVIRKLKYY